MPWLCRTIIIVKSGIKKITKKNNEMLAPRLYGLNESLSLNPIEKKKLCEYREEHSIWDA